MDVGNMTSLLLLCIYLYTNHESNKIIQSPYLFTLYTCRNERMKKKMNTRRLENKNEVWYDMNEWLWIWPIPILYSRHDTRTNGIWNSPNNQSMQIHAGTITRRLEAPSLEVIKTKDLKTEDLIGGSADQTPPCYTMYALSNTRKETLTFFKNWIIICIIDYFMEFSLF